MDAADIGVAGGRGVGIGIGLGILGGIVAAEAYRPRAGYYYDDEAYDGPYYAPTGYAGDPRSLCAQNFRSFEWNTGLYTTYGGESGSVRISGRRLSSQAIEALLPRSRSRGASPHRAKPGFSKVRVHR